MRYSICLSFFGMVSLQLGCSKMNSTPHDFSYSGTTPMTVEGGQVATTKQSVSVEFPEYQKIGPAPVIVGEESKLSSLSAGQTLQPKIHVNLGSGWAADGSRDGIKTIVAQISTGTNGTITGSAKILLDTISPQLSGKGIITNGVAPGKIMRPGESVELEWAGSDPGYRGSSESSGLATYSLGWTRFADCSPEQMTWVAQTQPYTNKYSNFKWPALTAAETFYICVIATDFANNSTTLLSQPMNSPWTVVAGDNNPGNGGSINAANVRFSFPGQIVVDSKKNIFINDIYSWTIRKVSPSGIISLYAGNGRTGGIVTSEVDAANYFLPHANSIAIDRDDRIYVAGAAGLFRISRAIEGQSSKIAPWLSLAGMGAVTIAVDTSDPSGDVLFLSSFDSARKVALENSYIFKMKIADMDRLAALGTVVNRAYLLENLAYYRFAGNGNGGFSRDPVPPLPPSPPSSEHASFSAANSPRLAADSIDFVSSMTPGGPGELFISTRTDGVGLGLGHPQIRLLKKDASGVLKNYLVSDGMPWVTSMLYLPALPGEASPQLLVAGLSNGFWKISGWSTQSPAVPATAVAIQDRRSDLPAPMSATGVALIPGTLADGSDSRLIVSEPFKARIDQLSRRDFSMGATWGRAVYDAQSTVATEAMINLPLGLTEGMDRDIYFFDALNHVIRKLDSSGRISWVAGHPGVGGRIAGSDPVTFENAYFNGAINATAGYRIHLQAMNHGQLLVMSDSSSGNDSRIRVFDLKNSLIRTPASGTNQWSLFGLAVTPDSAPSQAQGWVTARYKSSSPYASGIYATASSNDAQSTRLIGTDNPNYGFFGKPTQGVALNSLLSGPVLATVIDAQSNYYFVDGGSFYKIDTLGNLSLVVQSVGVLESIVLFENADGSKHFIGTTGSSLKYFNLAAGTGVPSAVHTLCIPGAYLNVASYLATSHDGNILISDSKNHRILKYFIRDSLGNFALKKVDPKTSLCTVAI